MFGCIILEKLGSSRTKGIPKYFQTNQRVFTKQNGGVSNFN